jgi:hypothetical protein
MNASKTMMKSDPFDNRICLEISSPKKNLQPLNRLVVNYNRQLLTGLS